MADLSGIQTATARKTVCDDATAEQASQTFIDAQTAAQQAALQTHYLRQIIDWCDVTDINLNTAAQATLNLPIDTVIDGNVLTSWESDLTGKGYIVTRDGTFFSIALN